MTTNMDSVDKIEDLLEIVNRLDEEIVQQLNSTMYNEDADILISLKRKEVEASELSIVDIARYIRENEEKIKKFAAKLFSNRKPYSLSIGISVTYAIYLIYLFERPDNLLDYLRRRRIPEPAKFLAQLQKIKTKL
jgi:hypothetical protein